MTNPRVFEHPEPINAEKLARKIAVTFGWLRLLAGLFELFGRSRPPQRGLLLAAGRQRALLACRYQLVQEQRESQ